MPQININSLLGNSGPSYPENIARPYREELIESGYEQLLTPEDVDKALSRKDDKVALVVLNSVCGCAARVARPGANLSLFNDRIPDLQFTVFAGMEKDAVTHFREKYLAGLTPSSPNIAIFKNGELVHILHRYQIERLEAGDIADDLIEVYNSICTKEQTQEGREKLRDQFIKRYQIDPTQLPTE
ncbi:MAG: BrxA/BrxB family bacilliredoxin [Bacteroidetes bacterium]|nr:MAG: BrxA/BrxB family bacilliredoxin [Bacteroidota bacterium]